jgi:hypothetical protein
MSEKFMFYVSKLPFILALIMIGFVFDFLIQLPFRVMVAVDGWYRKMVRSV